MLRPVILQLEARKRRKHEAYVKFFRYSRSKQLQPAVQMGTNYDA